MYKKIFKLSLVLNIFMIAFWCYYFIDKKISNSHDSIEFYPYNAVYYSNEELADIGDYKIPDVLKDYMLENEWKLYFSTLNIEPLFDYKKDFFSDRLGVTLMESNVVLIEVKGDKSQSMRTFYHELGHVFDKSLGMFSNSDAFKSFYDKYSDDYVYPIKIHGIFTDRYMNSTPSEFFAGIFEAYILYPEYLNENYPGIYHYFNILTSENKLI